MSTDQKLLLLGVVGFFGFLFWQSKSMAQQISNNIANATPLWITYNIGAKTIASNMPNKSVGQAGQVDDTQSPYYETVQF